MRFLVDLRDLTASGPPPAGKMDDAGKLSLIQINTGVLGEDVGSAAFAHGARTKSKRADAERVERPTRQQCLLE
jgi:hypothetical protein